MSSMWQVSGLVTIALALIGWVVLSFAFGCACGLVCKRLRA